MSTPSRERTLNPIIVKGARARLRKGPLLTWSIVVITLTGFLTAIVYLILTEQEATSPDRAAQLTLIPVIIIQAVLLMLSGTGSVAMSISQERDTGLLDYQRMTPMSPTSKLIGYLFGLPIREYVLFTMTLPFLAFGVIRSGMSLVTVAQFYLIFFSSVLVYHMTGLAAGMVSSKPRRAGILSMGMVLVLYFVLPNLSFFGLTFFEFLTIRPALFGMITKEIQDAGVSVQALAAVPGLPALDQYRSIPFFNTVLHPILYTLIVQGSLIVTLWFVVHRKWRDELLHPFTKFFGLVFYAGSSVFLLGSLWPILGYQDVFSQLLTQFLPRPETMSDAEYLKQAEAAILATALLMISLLVLIGAGLLTLLSTTPTTDKIKQGWRRASRLHLTRIPLNWDAASSLPITAVGAALFIGTYSTIAWLAFSNGRFITPPTMLSLMLPVVYLGMLMLFLQAALERFGKRAFFVVVFLLWMVPFFTFVLVTAAFEHQVAGAFVSAPFPPTTLFYMSINILNVGESSEMILRDGPQDLIANVSDIAITGTVFYTILALAMQLMAHRHRARLKSTTFESISAQ
jgi:hypothetical protein